MSNAKGRGRGGPDLSSTSSKKKVLLLHGNRQTGEILLGRMDKFKKALLRELNLEIVAPDSPHLFADGDLDCNDIDGISSDQWQRTWWHRTDNTYQGLEESLSMLDELWNNDDQEFVAIMGFSQGSRLAHIVSILHTISNGRVFAGLKCIVHFSGYGDVSLPDNLYPILKQDCWNDRLETLMLEDIDNVKVDIPSLHVMGEKDKLIPMKSSEALMKSYVQPEGYVHPGNHFVPVKKVDVERYMLFFNKVMNTSQLSQSATRDIDKAIAAKAITGVNSQPNIQQPDEDHAQAQIDEVSALAQIFPTEFHLLSNSTPKDPDNYDPGDYFEENRTYEHPIRYSIILQPQDECLEQSEEQLWPPKMLSLCMQYPAEYPDIVPTITLMHEMNYHEFSLQASDALMEVVQKAMEDEAGMPCIMGVVYAARDFFEGGGLASCAVKKPPTKAENNVEGSGEAAIETQQSSSTVLRQSSPERIKECNAQGLAVACTILGRERLEGVVEEVAAMDTTIGGGKGGRWNYTIGLVGKPSAGKSTFFNAATAFARQRGEGGGEARCDNNKDDGDDNAMLGGASMAPHPFTTINPNIGYCLVPAPFGACPEDDENGCSILTQRELRLGSTHGRDPKGRRFIPVCLKDVAGLVPGAYQGRGRGNAFLNDLTDADVLVHIVDASGTADAEGNKLFSDGKNSDDLNHPLNDLDWVRNELVEWVYSNVTTKWLSIARRGKQKLLEMFSGYKQSQSFTCDVFLAVERFVKEKEGQDHLFEQLETWDEGDIHRLVSAFLGARFPMALALNKNDIPSSTQYIKDIEKKLPIHGAHVGVGLSSHGEMEFVRNQLISSMTDSSPLSQAKASSGKMNGVWECLQEAISLREPILVFPINNFTTYEPLPGMTQYATRDSSLPNLGFISCITAAGGSAPSQWDSQKYTPDDIRDNGKSALRDCISMKPGSTVEDVFTSLKNMRALEGEFVRAEAASIIGDKPKPIPKSQVVGRHNRILRIMTTKKKECWQKRY